MPTTSAPSKVGKRERKRLARSELWLQLAMTAERWAGDIEGSNPGNVLPFTEWGDDDFFVSLARRYDLSATDLAALIRKQADVLERRALASGYDEVIDD